MQEFLNNPVTLWFAIGVVLLLVDIMLIGFSPVLFLGLAALLVSLVVWIGATFMSPPWNPSFETTLFVWSLAIIAVMVLGWRPLKRFQSAGKDTTSSVEILGRELVTTDEVTRTSGTIRWSGTDWQARVYEGSVADHLGAGVRVRVAKIAGITLFLQTLD